MLFAKALLAGAQPQGQVGAIVSAQLVHDSAESLHRKTLMSILRCSRIRSPCQTVEGVEEPRTVFGNAAPMDRNATARLIEERRVPCSAGRWNSEKDSA
jgi:hypothetical protein